MAGYDSIKSMLKRWIERSSILTQEGSAVLNGERSELKIGNESAISNCLLEREASS